MKLMSLYWVPEPGTYSNGSLARLRTVSLIEARTAPGGGMAAKPALCVSRRWIVTWAKCGFLNSLR